MISSEINNDSMKALILSIFILLAVPSGYAQVSQQFDFDTSESAAYHSIYGRVIPYIGKFDFDSLPEPNHAARVNFTLIALDRRASESTEFINSDWILKINYGRNTAILMGDTVFLWPAPHRPGDQFKGTLDFIPIMSGIYTIGIYPTIDGISYNTYGLFDFICWAIDSEGHLDYLGQPQTYPESVRENIENYSIRTHFFISDSLWIQPFTESIDIKRQPFLYEFLFKPAPRINDTTSLNLKLTATQDISDDCGIKLQFANITCLSKPVLNGMQIRKGQIIELAIDIMPDAVRNGHSVSLICDNCINTAGERMPGSQIISCDLIFNDDGTLRYASENTGQTFPEKYFPKTFPYANKYKSPMTITIR